MDGDIEHQAQQRQRRKHRIILHTSPFLRCLQTSIAISAGIAETQTTFKVPGNSDGKKFNGSHSTHVMHSGSPHIRAMEHLNSPVLSAIPEPEEFEDQHSPGIETDPEEHPKPCMRIDAFLGEWLSPSYYEDITHPPDSVMMMAGAKANLLREKPHRTEAANSKKPASGNFPGGWGGGSANANASTNNDEGPLTGMSGLNRSLPRLNRSSSHSSAGSLAHRSFQGPLKDLESASSADGYVSPIPSYAISPSAPIPLGYVAHAKDACLEIDYKWDSMRPPQLWPDGGQFGEEWISMHRRFRRGLQQMILWYQQVNAMTTSAAMDEGFADFSSLDSEADEDTDTVLVLVTHSAGCNALIGALTNQPVLLDAGMASLTMAVRRPNTDNLARHSPEPTSPGSQRRRSSIYLGISEDHEVKIIASTEHLRGGTTTPSRRSTGVLPSHLPERYRSASLASTGSSFSSADGGSTSELDGIDGVSGLQRSASAATPRSNGLWSKPTSSSSTGLWNKPAIVASPTIVEQKSVHKDSPLRQSLTNKDMATTKQTVETAQKPATGENDVPEGGSGLWGAPPAKGPSERERGPKRRWTHHEHR